MKKNLIRAYSAINLGDDLFIKILCDRYPEHQFYIITTKDKSKPFTNIPNLTLILRPRYIDGVFSRLNLKYRVENSLYKYYTQKLDSVIHIGGSIFMEHGDWDHRSKVYNTLVELSENFIVMGCNFGPFSTPSFFNRYQNIFEKVNAISFRDEYSYNLFPNLENTCLAPDIVFSLSAQNVDYILKNPYVVVSVMDLTWRENLKDYQIEYEESIVEIIKRLNAKNIEVVLMSFCKAEGDEQAIRRIMEMSPTSQVTSYFYEGDIEESLEVINGSVSVVATRFHSMILGWVFDKPVFPYIYSKKTSNVLQDSEFKGYSLEISEIDEIDYDKVVNQLINSKPHNIDKEKTEAEKHFFSSDILMKKETSY